MMWVCRTCGVEKPRTDFSPHPGGPGHRVHCKDCLTQKKNSRYRTDPEYRERVKQRAREYTVAHGYRRGLARHGLTPESYDELLASQHGGCACCGRMEPGGKNRRFHVDHDHACCSGEVSCGNCIRGLLCHWCNTALGLVEDDPWRLVDYLNRYHDALSFSRYIERDGA